MSNCSVVLNHLNNFITKNINKNIECLQKDTQTKQFTPFLLLYVSNQLSKLENPNHICGTELNNKNIPFYFHYHNVVIKNHLKQNINISDPYSSLGALSNLKYHIEDINKKLIN